MASFSKIKKIMRHPKKKKDHVTHKQEIKQITKTACEQD